MSPSHEHIGTIILAKIKINILTRAELLINLCYEIPCSICGPPSPNQNDHRMDYLVSWKQSPWANLDVIQRPLLSQIGHLTVTLGTFGKWDAITHGLSVCLCFYLYLCHWWWKKDKDSSSYRTYLFDFDYSLWRTNWKWRQVVGRYLAYKKMIEILQPFSGFPNNETLIGGKKIRQKMELGSK